jgi:hypothetical protein
LPPPNFDHLRLSSPPIEGERGDRGHPKPHPARARLRWPAGARDQRPLPSPKLARSWLPTEWGARGGCRGRGAPSTHGSAPGGCPIPFPLFFSIAIRLRVWDPRYVSPALPSGIRSRLGTFPRIWRWFLEYGCRVLVRSGSQFRVHLEVFFLGWCVNLMQGG